MNWRQQVVQIRRVTKVVQGGRKVSFRAVIVVGNENGEVGVGVGKATDVASAVKKGVAEGKKNTINIPLTSNATIPHSIIATSGAAKILLRPSAAGSGVIAGGAARTVLELGGVQNILSKRLGSNNPLNNARATINALISLKTHSQALEERGVDTNVSVEAV